LKSRRRVARSELQGTACTDSPFSLSDLDAHWREVAIHMQHMQWRSSSALTE